MKVQYFSVEDVKADQFGPLFPAKNLDVAKRMFKALMKDVDSEYYEDYFLHLIGCFDDATGVFEEANVASDPCFCAADFLEVIK